MFNFICKSFPHLKHSLRKLHNHELHCFQLNHILLSSYSSKVSQKPTSENAKDCSFTVNYFIKTCGFTPERAVSASNYMKIKRPDKADAVIDFLKSQGFSDEQVFKIINTRPQLLLFNPEKNLLPKFEFLLSRGFSKADMLAVFVFNPSICNQSLEKSTIPSFNLLEKFLGSTEKAIVVIACCPMLLTCIPRLLVPNIEILRKFGVPEARIRSSLTCWPHSFTRRVCKFEEMVEEVIKFGFDPLKSSFFIGLKAIFGQSRSSWDKKIEVYKKWGCSTDDVLAAFVKHPWCMLISEKKIDAIMGYFVNVMDWSPSMLIQKSYILSFSLNKRIIPRCSVYRVLVSKSLIKKLPSLQTLLCSSEDSFRKRCLECYEKQAPEILKLYQEKMKLPR